MSEKAFRAHVSIRAIWGDERFRFLLVGCFNTLFGFALFSVLEFAFGNSITIFGSLYISHFVGSTLAFVLYRSMVFTVEGHAWRDYLRFQAVYLVPLLTNTFLLPILIAVFGLNPYLAQGASLVILTFVSYFGHKYFSFRRTRIVTGEE